MTKRIKLRTLLAGGLITLLFVALWGRIYWVQVAHAEFWAEQARNTWVTTKKLVQERGTITDRSGAVLASDAAAYTLALSPKVIHELDAGHPDWKLIDQIAAKVNNILGKPEAEIRKIMDAKTEKGVYYVQREVQPEGWKMDKEVADRLTAFRDQLRELTGKKDVGIYLVEDKKRYYPNGSLGSQILGYVSKEGVAKMGLERTLDDELKGEEGSITYQKDGKRTQLADGEIEAKQAVDGKNVTLTIDRDIQYYMEQAMKTAYAQYRPLSMTAIAADPKTMDILGMVSLPDFDPNNYWDYAKDQSAFKNNAVQSIYEPGSTFKIMTLAAAVQEGLFNPNDKYMSGSVAIPKSKPVNDIKRGGWGEITYLEGLKRSSNVAFVKLGYEKLGKEKFKQYIDNFGFGHKTGIELAGEIAGTTQLTWERDYAAATFGQAVSVTPIQQVAAVAAVANGGKLMTPHIIKSVSDPNTGEKVVTEPKVIRQVISAQTSKKVGEYLEQVVSDREIGTGRNAYIDGYRIAGKTGTAQKVINGVYAEDKFVVSFIGYAPVEDPKIVLYVLVDEPEDKTLGGGSGAAPIFKEIMQKSLLHLGVLPTPSKDAEADKKNKDNASATPAPVTAKVIDVKDMTAAQAKSKLGTSGFDAIVLGKGDKVVSQLPKPGAVLPTSQHVYLMTEKTLGSVPSMKGLSLRDALDMCSLLGASCTATGQGYVSGQQANRDGGKLSIAIVLEPPAGTTVQPTGGQTSAGKQDESAAADADAGDNAAEVDDSALEEAGD
ncbi:penicillin-binding transpeptidase domain-containing protein [Cohnella rhizosphaerae]|uniref:Penicillin-binding transpeptidase domain-containing protein n=1 Tax=Cohnella rhizosphaerae TaxID=1457232 RepID=A0A9X4KVZ1_9BACL|nr:penicillin-binding transpeptidase domain-containing protein [Cohnella rhizosphaerae]MDG0812196.1 penicillin-binding transpeptidase domain-containing protein [Cohnella rhizosphaerae]